MNEMIVGILAVIGFIWVMTTFGKLVAEIIEEIQSK